MVLVVDASTSAIGRRMPTLNDLLAIFDCPAVDNSQIVVLVVEEYGYRQWLWMPAFDGATLEAWWRDCQTVLPYFYNPGTTLPPVMRRMDLSAAGWEASRSAREQIIQFPNVYSCHLHDDDDSWLRRHDQTILYHGGYTGSRSMASD